MPEITRLSKVEIATEIARRRREGLALIGNTYPIKDTIKDAGGLWDPDSKTWLMPDRESRDRYQAIVPSKHVRVTAVKSHVRRTPARRTSAPSRGTRTGCSCGSVEEYSKASDCWTCRHDAE